jgi:hypothetical protein
MTEAIEQGHATVMSDAPATGPPPGVYAAPIESGPSLTPAVQVEGEIFKAAAHPIAFQRAADKLAGGDTTALISRTSPEGLDGFVTRDGKFISREEANKILKEESENTGKDIPTIRAEQQRQTLAKEAAEKAPGDTPAAAPTDPNTTDLTGQESLPDTNMWGPIKMHGYRGAGTVEAGLEIDPPEEAGLSAQYGHGEYWTSVPAVAEEFAAARPGGHVQEGEVVLKKPFNVYNLDLYTAEAERYAELLVEKGINLSLDDFNGIRKALWRQAGSPRTLFPGGREFGKLVQEAGYDGIVDNLVSPDFPDSIQMMKFYDAESVRQGVLEVRESSEKPTVKTGEEAFGFDIILEGSGRAGHIDLALQGNELHIVGAEGEIGSKAWREVKNEIQKRFPNVRRVTGMREERTEDGEGTGTGREVDLNLRPGPASGINLTTGMEVDVPGFGTGTVLREATPEEAGDLVIRIDKPLKPNILAPGRTFLMNKEGINAHFSEDATPAPETFAQPGAQAKTPVTPRPNSEIVPRQIPGAFVRSRAKEDPGDEHKAAVSPGVRDPENPNADGEFGPGGTPQIIIEDLPKDITLAQKYFWTPQVAAYQSQNPDYIRGTEIMINLDVKLHHENEWHLARDRGQMNRLPKDWHPDNDKDHKFFDLMDTTIRPEEIAGLDIPESVKPILRHFKNRAQDNHDFIVGRKRDSVRGMLNPKTNDGIHDEILEMRTKWLENTDADKEALPDLLMHEFEPQEVEMFGTTVTRLMDLNTGEFASKAELIDALTKAYVPDNWGKPYGHIYHAFFGRYMIWRTDKSGEIHFIGRAETKAEAHAQLKRFHEANPDLDISSLHARPESQVPRDLLRLSAPAFRHLTGKIADAANASDAEMRAAIRGDIGVKQCRQKFWGPLKERKGAEGYSTDFWRVWEAEQTGFHRWKYLTQMNREVQPIIEKLKKTVPGYAKTLEAQLEYTWGTSRGRIAERVDEIVQGLPVIGDHMQPMALERWLGAVRTVNYMRHLQTPRFFLINSFQPMMTLYPLLGEARMGELPWRTFNKEGRELLERHKVGGLAGGQFVEQELSTRISSKLPAGFSESNNLKMAFVGMYHYGREVLGMGDAEAADYARLNGMVRTQFMFTRANQPFLLRGPILQTMMQYRRFAIANLGHFVNMLSERGPAGHKREHEGKGPRHWYNPRRYSGPARWFMMYMLTGGLKAMWPSLILGLTGQGGALNKMFRALEDSYGERTAKMITYGLPSLMEMDLSGSVSVFEFPEGDSFPEALGNALMGPSGDTAMEVTKAAVTKKTVYDTPALQRMAEAFMQTSPSLNPLSVAMDVMSEDTSEYDIKGRLRHRRDTKDLIFKALSLRPLEQSIVASEIDWFLESGERYDSALDSISSKILSQDFEGAIKIVHEWNGRYPAMMIDFDAITARVQARIISRYTDQKERQFQQLPSAVKRYILSEESEVTDADVPSIEVEVVP